jgi:hypothetical protein
LPKKRPDSLEGLDGSFQAIRFVRIRIPFGVFGILKSGGNQCVQIIEVCGEFEESNAHGSPLEI